MFKAKYNVYIFVIEDLNQKIIFTSLFIFIFVCFYVLFLYFIFYKYFNKMKTNNILKYIIYK